MRAASAEQKDAMMRQTQRLRNYAVARDYEMMADVTEIASGRTDEQPKLKQALRDAQVGERGAAL
jgi:putative resolvase